jgi:hypothetical protein
VRGRYYLFGKLREMVEGGREGKGVVPRLLKLGLRILLLSVVGSQVLVMSWRKSERRILAMMLVRSMQG